LRKSKFKAVNLRLSRSQYLCELDRQFPSQLLSVNGEYYAPSIPLSKSEVGGMIRDCAGAMEELPQLQRGAYSAIKVSSSKLLDIIEAVDYRQAVRR
jgi:hypothetical protein